MIKRSDIRHACFRAKKGAATPDNMKTLESVEPLLSPSQNWSNFATNWDILISKGAIKIIKPEIDVNFIRDTCLEKHFQVTHNTNVVWSDRKANIIDIVETLILDGIMTWEGYNTIWGVDVDLTVNMIKTVLYREPTQTEVTDEMITASSQKFDLVDQVDSQGVADFTTTVMTPEQVAQFEQFMNDRKAKR